MKEMRLLFSLLGVLLGIFCGVRSSQAGLQNANRSLDSALRPQKIALVIGINRSHQTSHWRPLRYAQRDAQQMARTLRKQGKFDKILIYNTPKVTTTKALVDALKELHRWVKNSEDTALVYISAHGTLSRGRSRYIVTSDTTQHIVKTGLAVSRIQRILQQMRSQKIGLILATCYTGSVLSKSVQLPGSKGNNIPAKPFHQHRAIQILSAASYAQAAFESTRLRADIYTHFFLDCLRKLKQKTIIRVHVCASSQTTPYVQKLNGEVQVPKAYSMLGANRDFSLSQRISGQSLGYFRSGTKGKQWLLKLHPLGRKGRSLRSKHSYTMSGPTLIALPSGWYKVTELSSKGVALGTHTILIREGRVSTLPSEWTLDFQGLVSFSTKGGSQLLGGTSIGIHHRFFGLKLGISMASHEYPWSSPSYQLLLDLRLEAGYRFHWSWFELFLGAYVGTGLLFTHLLQPAQQTEAVSLFSYGMTAAPCFWIHPSFGVVIQGDLGFSLFQKQTFTNVLEASIRVGLYVHM